MDMTQLFPTKERLRLLQRLLASPEGEIVPGRLAREAKVSKSQAHKYVAILRRGGLVRGRRLSETPELSAIRALLNVERMESAGVAGMLLRHFPKASGIGMFGSWASGTNAQGSDLDIWVKLPEEPGDLQVARARRAVSGKVGAPVDIVAATPERLARLREKSDAFYFSLFNCRVLWGDGL